MRFSILTCTFALALLLAGIFQAVPAQASSDSMATGKAVYEKSCSVCHASGVAGAPKVGDKQAWSEGIGDGIDSLVQIAINGQGAMPPKGGNAALTDDEVKAAVHFMVQESK